MKMVSLCPDRKIKKIQYFARGYVTKINSTIALDTFLRYVFYK